MIQKKTPESKPSKEDSQIGKIKDNHLREILIFLISKEIINKKKINWNGEVDKNIKQDIEESIKDKYNNINERFSEIRKSGKDLGVLNFKLMMLPLKIKVFLSTYEKKDAENIINRMEEIEKELG